MAWTSSAKYYLLGHTCSPGFILLEPTTWLTHNEYNMFFFTFTSGQLFTYIYIYMCCSVVRWRNGAADGMHMNKWFYKSLHVIASCDFLSSRSIAGHLSVIQGFYVCIFACTIFLMCFLLLHFIFSTSPWSSPIPPDIPPLFFFLVLLLFLSINYIDMQSLWSFIMQAACISTYFNY